MSAAATPPAPAAHPGPEPELRLFISDLEVAYHLLTEARYRTLERLFGVSRDQANLLTVVALLTLAESMRRSAERVSNVQGPSRADTMLGAAVLREAVYGVGGVTADQTRMFGVLVAIAVVARLSAPAVRSAVHNVRTGSQRLQSGFRHRYGQLIRRPRRPDRFRRRPDRGYLLESELAGIT